MWSHAQASFLSELAVARGIGKRAQRSVVSVVLSTCSYVLPPVVVSDLIPQIVFLGVQLHLLLPGDVTTAIDLAWCSSDE